MVARAEILAEGLNIETAIKEMSAAGYKETRLDMESIDQENRIKFWGVAKGVLIATYSTKTKEVICLSYWLTDERPKAFRKEFDFSVVSFDTETGLMKIQTRKSPKEEPAGTGHPDNHSE